MTRREPGLRHRIRYRFDNLLARGTAATLVWLGVVTLLAVLVSSVLLTLFRVTLAGSTSDSWLEDYWQSLLRVMDTGTMAADVGWGRRVLALAVTVFGVLVAGTLIGIIATGVEDRTARMRRGRSVVIERDHMVILGGSGRLPAIIEQLGYATPPGATDTVVVLADRDPTELHESVRSSISDRHHTHVVYRAGDPTRRADLALVALPVARGVIVLADDAADRLDDTMAVQTVLAVLAELGEVARPPIVVEVDRVVTAERLVRACPPNVHPIVPAQAIGRTAAFALRQRGLSQVLDELTDYRGCDIQVTERPELVGCRFEEVVVRFANARPLGWIRAEGPLQIHPPADAAVHPGDRLVLLAQDPVGLETTSSTVQTTVGTTSSSHPRQPGPGGAPPAAGPPPAEERILVLGWNRLGPPLLSGWATSAAPSSSVAVAVDPALLDPEEVVVPDVGVEVSVSPLVDLAALVRDRWPTTAVLLGAERPDPEEADTRTLLDLLELRRLAEDLGIPLPRLVVHLRDDRHEPLVDLPGPDDLLLSESLGSQFIAQLVGQPERRHVLLQLYAEGDPSIRLLPADLLGLAGDRSMGEVVRACSAAGLLAIGWRRASTRGGELVLNAHVDERVVLAPDDEIVVIT